MIFGTPTHQSSRAPASGCTQSALCSAIHSHKPRIVTRIFSTTICAKQLNGSAKWWRRRTSPRRWLRESVGNDDQNCHPAATPTCVVADLSSFSRSWAFRCGLRPSALCEYWAVIVAPNTRDDNRCQTFFRMSSRQSLSGPLPGSNWSIFAVTVNLPVGVKQGSSKRLTVRHGECDEARWISL